MHGRVWRALWKLCLLSDSVACGRSEEPIDLLLGRLRARWRRRSLGCLTSILRRSCHKPVMFRKEAVYCAHEPCCQRVSLGLQALAVLAVAWHVSRHVRAVRRRGRLVQTVQTNIVLLRRTFRRRHVLGSFLSLLALVVNALYLI